MTRMPFKKTTSALDLIAELHGVKRKRRGWFPESNADLKLRVLRAMNAEEEARRRNYDRMIKSFMNREDI